MNARSHNESVARRLIAKIKSMANRALGRGTDALIPFLVEKVKVAVSVPGNPRVPAKRGAPPRRITGHLMRNVFGQKWGETKIVIGSRARSKKGFNYPYFHEVKRSPRSGLHQFVKPTVKKYQADIRRIMRAKVVQVGYGFGAGIRKR